MAFKKNGKGASLGVVAAPVKPQVQPPISPVKVEEKVVDKNKGLNVLKTR